MHSHSQRTHTNQFDFRIKSYAWFVVHKGTMNGFYLGSHSFTSLIADLCQEDMNRISSFSKFLKEGIKYFNMKAPAICAILYLFMSSTRSVINEVNDWAWFEWCCCHMLPFVPIFFHILNLKTEIETYFFHFVNG